MIKRYTLFMLVLSAVAEIMVFCACSGQKMRCVTGINDLGHYYILEFDKMNQEDSCVIPASRDDAFAVSLKINEGDVDFIIGMDGKKPIYKGNDIDTGSFKVIVPEDGDYRITVNAKHASGSVEVYARREKSNQT